MAGCLIFWIIHSNNSLSIPLTLVDCRYLGQDLVFPLTALNHNLALSLLSETTSRIITFDLLVYEEVILRLRSRVLTGIVEQL